AVALGSPPVARLARTAATNTRSAVLSGGLGLSFLIHSTSGSTSSAASTAAPASSLTSVSSSCVSFIWRGSGFPRAPARRLAPRGGGVRAARHVPLFLPVLAARGGPPPARPPFARLAPACQVQPPVRLAGQVHGRGIALRAGIDVLEDLDRLGQLAAHQAGL